MAFDQQELNRRRAIRAEKRKQRQRNVRLQLASAAIVLVVLVAFLVMSVSNIGSDGQTTPPTAENLQTNPQAVATDPVPDDTVPPTQAPAEDETRPNSPTTVIHVAAAGDLIVNDETVSAGRVQGGYDYAPVFMEVAPVFAEADLALLNFEGNLVGTPYGTESVSAPQELVQAVKDMGVDLVQMANSCSVNHGVKGLATTLEKIREVGLEPLGAYGSAEEFREAKGYTIVNVQGIRIALVAFTKGVGGLSLPAGSEECVNLLYTDYATTYQKIDREGITAILSDVSAEKPDITIALVHWGSEYKDLVTKNQETIAKLMTDNGVDVVLGTHSHMLHQIDYDPISGQMVAYSLGDFFGAAERAGTDYSIILDLEITRDNASGDTRVTDFSYTPIYTLTERESADGQRHVVRLEDAMGAYEENFVGKVSESVYNDMTHALERIHKRITPEEPEEEQ